MQDILEFGIKRENEERRDGGCTVVFNPKTEKYAVGRDENGRLLLFSGGLNPGEDSQTGALRELKEESGLCDFLHVEKIDEVICHFYNGLKNVNRIAHSTCYLVILKSDALVPTQLEEHEKFTLAWVTAEELISIWESRNQNKDYDHWIYFLNKSILLKGKFHR